MIAMKCDYTGMSTEATCYGHKQPAGPFRSPQSLWVAKLWHMIFLKVINF